jgi:Sec-independent protein secretion pathway component TatC
MTWIRPRHAVLLLAVAIVAAVVTPAGDLVAPVVVAITLLVASVAVSAVVDRRHVA